MLEIPLFGGINRAFQADEDFVAAIQGDDGGVVQFGVKVDQRSMSPRGTHWSQSSEYSTCGRPGGISTAS